MRSPLRSCCDQKIVQIALLVTRVKLRSNYGCSGWNSIEVRSPRSHHQIFGRNYLLEYSKYRCDQNGHTALELCSNCAQKRSRCARQGWDVVTHLWSPCDRCDCSSTVARPQLDWGDRSSTASRLQLDHCERSSTAVRPKVTELWRRWTS